MAPDPPAIQSDAALRPFTAGTFRVKKFVQEHDLANRLHAQIWLLNTYAIPAGIKQVRSGLLLTFGKAKRWTITYRSGC
eukprot:1138118-Pelagomonas_calceolata.AAC.2